MANDPSINWEALRLARETLVSQIGNRPEIGLIDIGLDPQLKGQPGPVVIRVHVRRQWTQEKVPIPEQVAGVGVVVVVADYHLE